MVAAMVIIILLVGFIFVFIGALISTQRKLVNLDELCQNAMSQIGVQQSSRWDALTALADLTKGYSEHEHRTLCDIIAQRRPLGAHATTQEAQAQENTITQAMSRFMAITEAYPEIKASSLYLQTMDSVKRYEENVRMSRMVYNDTVTKFNREIRQIPICFFAGGLGFRQRDYLQEETAKAQMPNMMR